MKKIKKQEGGTANSEQEKGLEAYFRDARRDALCAGMRRKKVARENYGADDRDGL